MAEQIAEKCEIKTCNRPKIAPEEPGRVVSLCAVHDRRAREELQRMLDDADDNLYFGRDTGW